MEGNRFRHAGLRWRALAILETLRSVRTGEHVFPGRPQGKPLSKQLY
jgi:hypothetical protein